MAGDLAELLPTGRIRFSPHAGQVKAWNSERRIVLVLAGTQGGKTSFGPHWLLREIQRSGPGDYLCVAPTFQLWEKKALGEFRRLFEQWGQFGRYVLSPTRHFRFSEDGARKLFGHWSADRPTTVLMGYAEDPESLESMTARAAWCDEAGQRKFKLGSWEAIMRRLSLAQGRVLVTTTPYDLGWLKQTLYDPWTRGDPSIDVVSFDSTLNPQFSRAEFERARASMPAWRFDLFYRARFTRPAGLIYDSFVDERAPAGHLIPRFELPAQWPRFVGLDFGGVNTAAMFYAQEMNEQGPTGRLIAYREYHAGGRTAAQHARALLVGEPRTPLAVGGSHSETQWRQEFRAGGLPVAEPPVRDVEVGIDRVWGAHKEGAIVVFEDLEGYLSQKRTYSREVDEAGNVTEEIADKEQFHLLDAERYVISHLRQPARKAGSGWRSKRGGYV